MGFLPLRGSPEGALPRLVELVAELTVAPAVGRFGFGCHADLAGLRDRLGCDHFFALYAADTPESAARVRDGLDRAFAGRPGHADLAAVGSAVPGDVYVCVAVWRAAAGA